MTDLTEQCVLAMSVFVRYNIITSGTKKLLEANFLNKRLSSRWKNVFGPLFSVIQTMIDNE